MMTMRSHKLDYKVKFGDLNLPLSRSNLGLRAIAGKDRMRVTLPSQ